MIMLVVVFRVILRVNLNTQNNFIHEDTNLRFYSFTRIWFDYEKEKQTIVNKAIRNENTTTTTHLQDLQAPRNIVKRNQPFKHASSKLKLLICRIASEHMVHTIILQKYRNDVALLQRCADRIQKPNKNAKTFCNLHYVSMR